MPTTQLPSKPILKTSLEALGLPTWGSRQKMFERLTGAADAKKPAPTIKKKACATSLWPQDCHVSKTTSASTFDAAELKFFAEERPRLIAQGITDPVRQNAELQRRYKEIQALKNGTSTKATVPKASIIPSATPFSAAQMKQLGVTLLSVAPDSSGTVMYNYTKTPPAKTAKAPAAAAKANDGEESDGDSDGDSAMDECEDIVIDRLMKLPKELLKDICKAYGVETSGSKQDLAELAAEQLTNETGDDSDGSDDEDA